MGTIYFGHKKLLMRPQQLNLWTGKHPSQNIIDRVNAKINRQTLPENNSISIKKFIQDANNY
jgi:hypothetical protein